MRPAAFPAGDDNCSNAWSRETGDVLDELAVDPLVGLDAAEIVVRRARYGRNQLRSTRRRSSIAILLDQFRSLVVLLLAAAGTLAMLFSDFVEGIAIFAVIAINCAIGFVTEWRAVRSMEALRRLGHVETIVVRGGNATQIPAEELVPGDIVIREGGDIVTADIRLIETAKLQADESTLTGESLPVTKTTEQLPRGTPLMERANMAFKGTAITRGSGRGVVVATGFNTELGKIAELVSEAEAPRTPLEKRLDRLAQRLIWSVLLLSAAIALAGVLAGRDTILAIEVAIALAVAAIPEGLPIVATIALARGMWRMARHNALISRLSAVETLGATSVILTDKTGTLTENRMTATTVQLTSADVTLSESDCDDAVSKALQPSELDADSLRQLDELLVVSALCSNASVRPGSDGALQSVGDPTEVALLAAALQRELDRNELLQRHPEIREWAFDPESRLMATLHRDVDHLLLAVKGAPEAVIACCSAERTPSGVTALNDTSRRRWLQRANELGGRGLRTLAIASKKSGSAGDDPYAGLVLLGIVGLEDPPRAGVKRAIDRCRNAGITVIMVTGDHAATAGNIAAALGIVAESIAEDQLVDGQEVDALIGAATPERILAGRVFSRVTPEQKLSLIDFFQRQNQVVAMTGDGVNDAPALKKADIGVAMGVRGTAVAKEASAMVLQDDEFGTIVEAVAQGRAIYENIRKFVVYLLSCNISEVLIVSVATIVGAPLPLLPLQILFLNLVTDVFPALALGMGEGSPLLMQQRPRPASEPILTRMHWTRIALHGLVISATVLGAMMIAAFRLEFSMDRAVTISFCTLALAQVWHVFNMRNNSRQWIRNEITRNPWIWVAIAICVALILTAVYVPPMAALLELRPPGAAGWLLIVAMSFVPVLIAPLVHRLTPGRPAS